MFESSSMHRAAWLSVVLIVAVLGADLTIRTAPVSAARSTPPHLALWMEPGANLSVLSSVEGVRRTLDRAKQAGVDVVIPEAKNAWGYVTYLSAFAPSIGTSPIPHQAPPSYPPPAEWYPPGYDMLGTIIQEAHARGMRVDVAVNSFGEGFTPLRAGPAFQHPEWQATAYLGSRPIQAPDGTAHDLSGVDVPRGDNDLVLYAPGATTTPTSRWGVEVTVASGKVAEVRDRSVGEADPGPTSIPSGGFVLSGHGEAARWLARALPVGAPVTIGPPRTRMVPSSAHSIFAFVNPADPQVYGYEMAVIYEVLSRYDVDGIVLDRTRYQDISEDFSPLSQARFEAFIGRPVHHWPQDIYAYAESGYWVTRRPGPLYRAWLGYRAQTILAYTRAVAHLVHAMKPKVAVAMYVGAWYPVYYDEGVNWASPEVQPSYPWIGQDWIRAGLAPLLDYLMIGLYYRPVTVGEAWATHHDSEISIQGGALLGLSLLHGETPLVGSLLVSLYQQDPERLTRAVQMAQRVTRGAMLFDLVYLNQDDLWRMLPRP
jgi:uncharacterized lipoprotein YddW (UPF0748 family)